MRGGEDLVWRIDRRWISNTSIAAIVRTYQIKMDTRYNTTSNGQPNNGRWLPDMNLLNKLFDSNHVVESPEKPNESISNHKCTNRRLPRLNILHILSDSNFVVESPPTCSLLTCSNTETENSCSIGHAGIYLLGRFSTARTNTDL